MIVTPPIVLADAGTLERVFDVLHKDPVVGFLALAITALAMVSTALWNSYRVQLRDTRADLKAAQTALDSEQQKRVDLALTVVAINTKAGLVLDEAMATLTSVDDILPTVLSQLERLGLKRRAGGGTPTGSTPTVRP